MKTGAKNTHGSNSADGMKCNVCIDAEQHIAKPQKPVLFVAGVTSYKLDSIVKHQCSRNHEIAIAWREAQDKKGVSQRLRRLY